jgi:hypothetical protein
VRGGNKKGGEQRPPPFGSKKHYCLGALYEMR